MNIKIALIENSISNVVSTTLEQLKGVIEPTISEEEAIIKLGTISEVVLTLYDQAKKNNINDDVLEYIWELKRESDTNLQILFEKSYGI
ncbi:MAG: hypothetical protein RSA57_03725 [Cetobacterium sp.]|uniref:hypothetical protein n=1 Tax=Bacteria TaxID=2 RepID=UPI002FCA39F0